MPGQTRNKKAFTEALDGVIRSCQLMGSTRACLLRTRDREHALNELKRTATDLGRPLFHFTLAARRRFNPGQLQWEIVGTESGDAPSLLRSAQELRGGAIVILEDCASHLRDEGGDVRLRMLLAQMLSSETPIEGGLVVVFLESPEAERYLPSILADQVIRLDASYPRFEELAAIAREEIARVSARAKVALEPALIHREGANLAHELAGLTHSAARDAVRDALASTPNDFAGAAERLRIRKSEHLRRELAMNILDTTDVEMPIGLDYLMEFLRIHRDRMTQTGPGRARGILLLGPPGTGKTMLARAIGKLVGLPVVEFRLSSLMNSLLGETERRFAQAFATLEAMSPNVVFIDEIEKAFGESSERDGGTMMRCTGALLSWLSDNPNPNFVVGTCNSLKRMGELGLTMTRSERFDVCFLVDLPNTQSRFRMLQRWLTGQTKDVDEMARELASLTEKFSGADLRSVVKQAAARAMHAEMTLSIEMLKEEIQRKRLRAVTLYDEFQELRHWGRMFCELAGPDEDQAYSSTVIDVQPQSGRVS